MATPMLNCCSFKQGMYLPNGYGPNDSCPLIIQTVADISEAVDGTQDGQLTIVRYIDGDGNQHIHLYGWNGSIWVEFLDTSSRLESGLFVFYGIAVGEAGWEVSVDEGATWVTGDVTFDPPVASIAAWFRNIESGCVYTNVPQLPLENACYVGAVIYPDFVSIPAGGLVGEPAMVSEFDGSFERRSIYTWDGANWIMMAEVIAIPPAPYDGGGGANCSVFYIDPTWFVSFDSGATWVQNASTVVNQNPLTVRYKNSIDCIYINDNIT